MEAVGGRRFREDGVGWGGVEGTLRTGILVPLFWGGREGGRELGKEGGRKGGREEGRCE